jgi:hypothetical protein
MRMRALGLVCVVGLSASLATAADKRSYTAGHFSLTLDGVDVGIVKSAKGGGLAADVATNSLGPTTTQKKHVTKFRYEPITLEVGLDASPAIATWIDETLTLTAQRRNATLFECSQDFKAVTEQAMTGSLIEEVTFPTLDASSKEPGYLKLEIVAEQSRRQAGGAACSKELGTKQKSALLGNFKVELDGIDTKGVAAIDAFTIKTQLVNDSIGEQRNSIATAAKVEIPNLTLSVARAQGAEFEAWANDFLVKGNNGDDKEKSGAIVFLDPTLKETARLSLTNVGISGFTVDPKDPARLKVSLYVEGMRYTLGGAKPKAVKSAAVAAKAAPAKAAAKVVPAKATKK